MINIPYIKPPYLNFSLLHMSLNPFIKWYNMIQTITALPHWSAHSTNWCCLPCGFCVFAIHSFTVKSADPVASSGLVG